MKDDKLFRNPLIHNLVMSSIRQGMSGLGMKISRACSHCRVQMFDTLWSHRATEVEWHLWGSYCPTFVQSRLASQSLNISKDRQPTFELRNLLQCLATLTVKAPLFESRIFHNSVCICCHLPCQWVLLRGGSLCLLAPWHLGDFNRH